MKTLIIVDFQKDFIDGSLAVPGAKDAENAIVNYIENNYKDISNVLFTVDWHSPKHCSFKKNDGIWPIHCVQYSEGAGISDKLINACIEYDLPIKIFEKGVNDTKEEYGAFERTYKGIASDFYVLGNDRNNIFIDIPNIVICGLAGDYCVKETIKNLLQEKTLNIEIFKNGVKSIDDGTTFDNFIKENNLKVI